MSFRRKIVWTFICSCVIGIGMGLGMTQASAQEKEAKEEKIEEKFRAFAVVMGNVATGANTTVQMTVSRWSTDEERTDLLTTLVEKGQEDFIKALRDQEETGFVRVTGRSVSRSAFPSQRLRYAREFREGNMRRIVLALDRPISFREAVNNPRTMDYDLTFIVFDIDEEKNEGEGLTPRSFTSSASNFPCDILVGVPVGEVGRLGDRQVIGFSARPERT